MSTYEGADEVEWVYLNEEGEIVPPPDDDSEIPDMGAVEWVYVDDLGNVYDEYGDQISGDLESDPVERVGDVPTEVEAADEQSSDDDGMTWIYVDEYGNPVEVDESQFDPDSIECAYVDAEGHIVDSLEDETPGSGDLEAIEASMDKAPLVISRKVTTPKKVVAPESRPKIKRPAMRTTSVKTMPPRPAGPKASPKVAKQNTGSAPTLVKKTSGAKPAVTGSTGSAGRATSPALVSRSSGSVRTSSGPVRSQTAPLRRPAVTKEAASLWPIFWMFIVGLGAVGGYLYYKDARSQPARSVAQNSPISQPAIDSVPSADHAGAGGVDVAVSHARVEVATSSIATDAPTSTVQPISVASVVAQTSSAKTELVSTIKQQMRPAPARSEEAMAVERVGGIPQRGLIAHYHARRQTGDSIFSRKKNDEGRIATWGNSAGDYENQNALIPEELDAEDEEALLGTVTGTTPGGKPFESTVIEFGHDSFLTSEASPFDTKSGSEKGATLVVMCRSISNGPLVTLDLTDGVDASMGIRTLGNRLKVEIEEDGLRHSAMVDHSNRDWRIVFAAWDAQKGEVTIRSASLDGKEFTAPVQKGPTFAHRLRHISIGPSVRAQFMDVLAYDRPLDYDAWEDVKTSLIQSFFAGDPPKKNPEERQREDW